MPILAQLTYVIKRLQNEAFYASLSPETVSLPADSNGGAVDYTNAKSFVKLFYDNKEIYPSYDAELDAELGGRNLVRGSAFLDLSQFTHIGANVSIDATNKINGLNSVKSIQSGLSDYSFRGLTSKISAKTGDTFALTIYSFTDNISSFDEFANCEVLCFDGNGSRVFPNGVTIDIKPTVNNVWQKNTSIFTITATNVVEIWVQPYVAKNGRLWFGGIKLERGNKATDWTPAPTEAIGTLATQNCSASINSSGQISVTNLSADAGYVDVPFNYGKFNTTKRFTLAKAKKGADGKSVSAVDVEYARSTSNSVAPTTVGVGGTTVAWQTTSPAWVNGQYIWSRVKTTYTAGSPSYSSPVCITGAAGSLGATGRGISSIVEQFAISTSKVTAPTTWQATPPAWVYGQYIWTRSLITYTSGSPLTETTTPVVSSEWEAVKDLQLSGRNLISDSPTITTTGYCDYDSEMDGYRYTLGTTLYWDASYGLGYFRFHLIDKIRKAGKYAVSFWYFIDDEGEGPALDVTINGNYALAPNQTVDGRLTNGNWVRYTGVVNVTSGINTLGYLEIGLTQVQSPPVFNISDIMVVEGNVPMEYTPAPEVEDARTKYLRDAMQGSTSVQGGLVLSNMIAVRNSYGYVVGGINGGNTSGNDVRLWFGSNIQNMDSAPFRIMEDGTIDINTTNQSNSVRINAEQLPALSEITASSFFDSDEAPVSAVQSNGNLDIYSNPLSGTTFSRTYSTTFIVPEDTANMVTDRKIFLSLLSSGNIKVPNAFVTQYGFPYKPENSYVYVSISINYVNVLTRKIMLSNPISNIMGYDLEINQIFNAKAGQNGSISFAFFLYKDPAITQTVTAQSPGEGYVNWDFRINQESCVYTDDPLTINRRTRVSPYGLSSILNKDNFFHAVQEGTQMKLGYRGLMDVPAGLGGGRSQTNNTVVNRWGRVLATSSRTSATTTIQHDIGDTKYTVLITPYQAWSSYAINNITSTSFVITCSGQYDFVIVRTPY